MKLGLTGDEIKLMEQTAEWSEEFKRVKQEIIGNTGIEDKRIEHIGSTAIKEIKAKPIIDILMAADSLENVDSSLIKGLEKSGFLRLKVKRPGEIVFAKFTDDSYKTKTHFIHLVEYGKDRWQDMLFFRDYLNAHEEARKQYEEIKLDYVKNSSAGINEYTENKVEFVNSIFEKRKS